MPTTCTDTSHPLVLKQASDPGGPRDSLENGLVAVHRARLPSIVTILAMPPGETHSYPVPPQHHPPLLRIAGLRSVAAAAALQERRRHTEAVDALQDGREQHCSRAVAHISGSTRPFDSSLTEH